MIDVVSPAMSIESSFRRLYDIVSKLRSPGGCPWDQEQTPISLRSNLVEEAYETIEAIDSGSPADVQEELGDLVMLVVSLGRMYEESGEFDVDSILDSVSDKLVRRHPHVFGNSVAASSSEVLTQWERIKVEDEGKPASTSIMDRVSRAMPALERANKLQQKAAKVGFDWPDLGGVTDKLQEELAEVVEANNRVRHNIDVDSGGMTPTTESTDAALDLEEEVGDLLFSAVNVARHLGIDPSIALNRANRKFVARFRAIESEMASRGLPLSSEHIEAMEEIWNQSKTSTKNRN